MLIKLIRNQSEGASITGRLVINGRWFCNTLERVGYQIPALCYQIRVTKSPKFKRLLPVVQNVPQRSGIRFHRGTKPQHSTGCILVLGDEKKQREENLKTTPKQQQEQLFRGQQHSPRQGGENTPVVVGGRTAADVEQELTQLLLQTQNNHEEIILDISDYRPGTEYGYNTPCPPELQKR